MKKLAFLKERSLYRDQELADQVRKARSEGSEIRVIVLLNSEVALKDAKPTTMRVLQRVETETGHRCTSYTMFRNMECFEIQCCPEYLNHLLPQPEVETVVQNNHSPDVLNFLLE